jgi:hypothetical protein
MRAVGSRRFIVKKRHALSMLVALGLAVAAGTAVADSTPVGRLPAGPTRTVSAAPGTTFRITLPAPAVAGGVWRVARAYDSEVVRQVGEGDSGRGVWLSYRAVAPGTTTIVMALTRGETARAFAARRFRVVVAGGPAGGRDCPAGLLPLTANPVGPSVAAALATLDRGTRPQVTGALVARTDIQRGPQVRARCGMRAWQRTVVVYVTERALLPSESAAQRVLFVGRTTAGYRVWQRAR